MNRGSLWVTLAAQRLSEALAESRRPLWCWLRMEPPQDVLTLNRWHRYRIRGPRGIASVETCDIHRQTDPRLTISALYLGEPGDPSECLARYTVDRWIRVKHELWRNGYPMGHTFKYYLWVELEADSIHGSEILEQQCG